MKYFKQGDIEEIIQSLTIDINLLKNKNIIISGGLGFIGKYILQSLINLKKINNIKFKI